MEFVRRLRISGKRRSYHRRLAPESRLGIKVQFAFFCHWQQEKMVIVRAMEREDIKKIKQIEQKLNNYVMDTFRIFSAETDFYVRKTFGWIPRKKR